MTEQTILDMCCGSRMFWFDKQDPRALFADIRSEQHTLCDGRSLVISPDIIADFRAQPFADASFPIVVFDPPHLERVGENAWMSKKYGRLNKDTWRDDLRAGFEEAFRVLRPHGVLIFKWNEVQIPVREILALTDEKPAISQRTGRNDKTHWILFVKSGREIRMADPLLEYTTKSFWSWKAYCWWIYLKQYGQRKSVWSSLRSKTPGHFRRTTSADCSTISIVCGWKKCRYRQLSPRLVRWPVPWRNMRERERNHR